MSNAARQRRTITIVSLVVMLLLTSGFVAVLWIGGLL